MDELAGVVGEASAHDLARHFGGTSVYVPRLIGEHHPIAAAIGPDAAGRLAAWAGGTTIGVPKQPELRSRVIAMRARGLTIVQIARETGYSERQVYRLLREEDDCRSPGLPGL